MPPYTTSQKQQIAEFVNCTRTKDSVAAKFLKESGWSLPSAIDTYFNAEASSHAVMTSPITKLFESYRDDPIDSPDTIGVQGAMRFLEDIDVKLDEVTCLAIAELLQHPSSDEHPSMGEFTRQGFTRGWLKLSCDTIERMTHQAKIIRKTIPQDPELFRRVYRFAFRLSKVQPEQRNLPFEIAADQWRLFFTADNGGVAWNTQSTPWLDWWIEFLEGRGKKPVNRDLWEQVEVFMRKTLEDEDMRWWSPEGAWPGAIDDFVAWVQAKRGNGSEMEVE